MRDVKNYDYKTDEAEFLDSGIKAKLVASWNVQTGQGKDAINFLYRVADGQKAISARTRDTANKVDVGGTYVLTQQGFEQEGQVKFTLNLMRQVLGMTTDDLSLCDGPAEQSGMINEVLISTEIKQVDGKNVVRVSNVAKLDGSLTKDQLTSRQSKWAHLIEESKKGAFKFEKKAKSDAAPVSGSGTVSPPPRDMNGSTGSTVSADDVPF